MNLCGFRGFESHPHRQISQVQTVNLTSVRPGLFTVSQDDRGTAGCLHTDGVPPVTAPQPERDGNFLWNRFWSGDATARDRSASNADGNTSQTARACEIDKQRTRMKEFEAPCTRRVPWFRRKDRFWRFWRIVESITYALSMCPSGSSPARLTTLPAHCLGHFPAPVNSYTCTAFRPLRPNPNTELVDANTGRNCCNGSSGTQLTIGLSPTNTQPLSRQAASARTAS